MGKLSAHARRWAGRVFAPVTLALFTLATPALAQTPNRWILPAFSPWAAGGGGWGRVARLWLCSPKRILPPR